MIGYGFVLFALAAGLANAQIPSDECPFVPGSCPVTIDNVVDVYFHDVNDYVSCQKQCQEISDCKNFTMLPVSGQPTDLRKCFLFKSCDHLETCPDCISGPDFPSYEDANCTYTGPTTCSTDLSNIVDVYYFDHTDTQSCRDQCVLLDGCNFWTHFSYPDQPRPHYKCFLFRDCNIQEPCSECETGPKRRKFHHLLL